MTVADNTKSAEGLDIRRLSGSLGAEVRGLSLAEASPKEARRIESLLMDHQVLFFPDQHLSPDSHIAFGERVVQRVTVMGDVPEPAEPPRWSPGIKPISAASRHDRQLNSFLKKQASGGSE